MKNIVTTSIAALLLTAAAPLVPAANWPSWRGPNYDGIAQETNLPVHWSPTENVRWHVDLPGPGNSSPIVWGDRVFVTQAVDAENRRTLMCFARSDGKLRWQSGVTYTEQEPTQKANPYCAASPVTDGERVIASFGSAGLYCYDFNGKEVWHRDFGKMNHNFGNASSPIIHGDLCVFPFGPDEKARLIAVNKNDGKTVWEVDAPKFDPSEQARMGGGPGGPGRGAGPDARPEGAGGQAGQAPEGGGLPDWQKRFDKNNDGKLDDTERGAMRDEFRQRGGQRGPGGIGDPGGGGPGTGGRGPGGDRRGGGGGGPGPGSWSTPIVLKTGDHEEVVMSFPYRVAGYDLATGQQRWITKGIGGSVYTSPVFGEGMIVATSSNRDARAVALKPGASGDIPDDQRAWSLDRVKSAIGSGVIHDGHWYTVSQEGIAECVDLQTGKSLWQERLPAAGARGGSWSSMVLAKGKIYVPNQSGEVFVIDPGPKLQVVATNSLGEPTNSSLAVSDDQIFLRTDKGLWCVGAAK